MSSLTVENRLLNKVLWSIFRSRSPHTEHHLLILESGLSANIVPQICVKDFAVNFVFKQFTGQLQNKEYLIAIFRHWTLSCKQFLSEHFAENRMTLTYGCKIVVHKLYTIFVWNTLYMTWAISDVLLLNFSLHHFHVIHTITICCVFTADESGTACGTPRSQSSETALLSTPGKILVVQQ